MGRMDQAKARGDYQLASECASLAAEYEEEALESLEAAHPERLRTIMVIKESARCLRVAAETYAQRAQ